MLESLPSLEVIRTEIARRRTEAEREAFRRNAEAIRERCWPLAGFVKEAWHVLEPNQTYLHGWHIDAICAHLEAVTEGRIVPRLLINVPPGTAKSLLVSVFWPAWEWGPRGKPSTRFLTSTYTENYVKRDSRRMRDLVLSEWYQALWGDKVKLTRSGEASFANSATGFREGVPFASLTAGRGDRVIIDDPHSTETAESDAERARTVRIFRESVTTRLNDPKTSAIVVIMQRLHEEDVSGVILKQGLGYEHLCLPMEFEPDRKCRTSIFTDPRTIEGELLFPERFPAEVVDRDKKVLGPYATAGQLQQRPSPRDGAYFQRSWFQRYRDKPDRVRIYGTSDYAVTAGAGDFTVHRVWGVAPSGDVYLLDGWRGQTSPDEWIERKLDLIGTHKPLAWFGEGGVIRRAIEPMLIRRSRERKVYCRFEWLTSIQDKATRARGFQARAAMGAVFVPEGETGDAWIEEMVGFPTAAHDDEIDCAGMIGRALDDAHPATALSKPATSKVRDRYADDDEGGSNWKTR